MGREAVVAVTDGKLDFGPWEQIFYGEFDGRRNKRVLVKVIGELTLFVDYHSFDISFDLKLVTLRYYLSIYFGQSGYFKKLSYWFLTLPRSRLVTFNIVWVYGVSNINLS
jgi:hypothetical protein